MLLECDEKMEEEIKKTPLFLNLKWAFYTKSNISLQKLITAASISFLLLTYT